ncbi:MAG: hypothetical protein H7248_03150 [Microbacteriaceae bacterium]|nr:hypothetical protein [Microbacteriaceae bacterium]
MTIESIRRGLLPGRAWTPLAMVLLVSAVVSGLLAMHVLTSNMGAHASTQPSDSAMGMSELAPSAPTPIVDAHALAHSAEAHSAEAHAAISPNLLKRNITKTVASTQCSKGRLPLHSMGSMACVLTLPAPFLLFASSSPPPSPVLSTDRLPAPGLALAALTLRAPDPPDLNVLSISRT